VRDHKTINLLKYKAYQWFDTYDWQSSGYERTHLRLMIAAAICQAIPASKAEAVVHQVMRSRECRNTKHMWGESSDAPAFSNLRKWWNNEQPADVAEALAEEGAKRPGRLAVTALHQRRGFWRSLMGMKAKATPEFENRGEVLAAPACTVVQRVVDQYGNGSIFAQVEREGSGIVSKRNFGEQAVKLPSVNEDSTVKVPVKDLDNGVFIDVEVKVNEVVEVTSDEPSEVVGGTVWYDTAAVMDEVHSVDTASTN
jgi:hypothetical protein